MPPLPSDAFFHVVPIPGKGMGAVATRDIAVGERILADSPLVVLNFDDFSEDKANAAVYALSPEQQAEFFDLGCQATAAYGSERTPLGILQNNCLPLGPVSEAKSAGLFPNAARFNHSCCPNVHHSWNPNIMRETIHAGRNIQSGEELCTSYIQLDQSREPRQRYLLKHFGFTCTCQACELQGQELADSNSRRSQASWIDNQISSAKHLSSAMEFAEQKMQVLQQEGIADPCMLRYAELDAYQICKLAGKHKEARKWLRLAYEHGVQAEGADSPLAQKYEQMLALPLKAPFSSS